MSKPIISVDRVGKRYRLAHKGGRPRYVTLRDVIAHKMAAPFRALNGKASKSAIKSQATGAGNAPPGIEDFWALKNVSFDVQQGEVVGIIGRNGAGKSTLLKILSRITEPTEGRIRVNGRVASLLEVGTGFHPELTGRENVFLNGAILGMQRAEIRRKFDEIVTFAEVEKFLDTPVKRYSSGMYVRLAFAVAAHLEPEILIVDEVLAVGDIAFQQKCLGKMRDVASQGRTVLFVSHNLSTLRFLCETGILLKQGQVEFRGRADEVIGRYIAENASSNGLWERVEPVPATPGIYFQKALIRNAGGENVSDLNGDERFTVELDLVATAKFSNAQIGIRFTNQEGIPAFTTCNTDQFRSFDAFEPGVSRLRIELDASYFMPGRYTLKIVAHIPQERALDLIDDGVTFFVHDVGNHINVLKDGRLGVLCPVIPWHKLCST